MPALNVTLTIPEADIARVQAAALAFTGLPESATAKQLLAAVVKQMTVTIERQQHAFTPPGVE